MFPPVSVWNFMNGIVLLLKNSSALVELMDKLCTSWRNPISTIEDTFEIMIMIDSDNLFDEVDDLAHSYWDLIGFHSL